ncbi:hypothetical protein [Xenorhabdus miraniensis]|uniref:Uncharacterized protein n=1 Tax=Xenorhabdus miraniensis TaxID=351674 RepID=A0A2D0JJP9_9GAMM|nr:hypothetical protein [Xenorhabdus miraniensis]PHM46510.1 hypothetical protein Xmir_04196 [Xenorhabdus miraniensis]
MTNEEQTLLMFKGLVGELPDDYRKNYAHCVDVIRKLITDYPNGEALLALGMIGAEQQMEGHWAQGQKH